MDERNIKGVIICIIMLLGLVVAMVFITLNDKKRVNSIDTSEAEKIIEEREKKDDDSKEEPEKEKKELSTFTNFELSYERKEAPTASYKVKLGADKSLSSDIDEKCSDVIECTPAKEHNDLKLSDYEYKLVIDLYNRLYTDEWPNNTKEMFVVSVSRLAGGNKEMYNSTGNGWEIYKTYDTDNDGKVLYREYGRYILENFENK